MLQRMVSPVKVSPFKVEIIDYPGNQSGYEPIHTKVLVLPDVIQDKVGSIQLLESEVERQTLAVCTGWLVAVGGAAFTDWPHTNKTWPGHLPKPGDRIYFGKYAGIQVDGDDGRKYRLIQDSDCCGVKK